MSNNSSFYHATMLFKALVALVLLCCFVGCIQTYETGGWVVEEKKNSAAKSKQQSGVLGEVKDNGDKKTEGKYKKAERELERQSEKRLPTTNYSNNKKKKTKKSEVKEDNMNGKSQEPESANNEKSKPVKEKPEDKNDQLKKDEKKKTNVNEMQKNEKNEQSKRNGDKKSEEENHEKKRIEQREEENHRKDQEKQKEEDLRNKPSHSNDNNNINNNNNNNNNNVNVGDGENKNNRRKDSNEDNESKQTKSPFDSVEILEPSVNTVIEVNRIYDIKWKLSQNLESKNKNVDVFLFHKDYKMLKLANNILLNQLTAQVYIPDSNVNKDKGYFIILCDSSSQETIKLTLTDKIGNRITCSNKYSAQSPTFEIKEKKYLPEEPYAVVFLKNPTSHNTVGVPFSTQPIISIVDINDERIGMKHVTDKYYIGLNVKNLESKGSDTENRLFSKGETILKAKHGNAEFHSLTIDKPGTYALEAFAYQAIQTPLGEIKENLKTSEFKPLVVAAAEQSSSPLEPTQLAKDETSPRSVVIRWNPPSQIHSRIDHYEIEVTGGITCCQDWLPPKISPTRIPFTLHCLCPDTKYKLNLYTVDVLGKRSKQAASIDVRTPVEVFEMEQPDNHHATQQHKREGAPKNNAQENTVILSKDNLIVIIMGITVSTVAITAFSIVILAVLVKKAHGFIQGETYSSLPSSDPYSGITVKPEDLEDLEDDDDDDDNGHEDYGDFNQNQELQERKSLNT